MEHGKFVKMNDIVINGFLFQGNESAAYWKSFIDPLWVVISEGRLFVAAKDYLWTLASCDVYFPYSGWINNRGCRAARRGDVIYRRDASTLRSREVKKRTRPDYSTRTGRNVQLSAPKLGLRRRVALRDPEVTSYVGYWLIDVPGQNFFHLFSFPLHTRQYPDIACTGEISYGRFSDQTLLYTLPCCSCHCQ